MRADENPTEWAAVATFAVGFFLQASGSLFSRLVGDAVRDRTDQRLSRSMTQDQIKELPIPVSPGSQKDLVIWAVDAVQAFSTCVFPVAAILVSIPGLNGYGYLFVVFCLIVFLFGIWLFVHVFSYATPSLYVTKKEAMVNTERKRSR
ncbi:hypothetical protein [Streptomyces sp. 5-6(2022)]|uniref:hypothetical protein n=1 Tax=Streptomyces sp. 5-6(2022) TaxID=2936510 RepID=UPI0023B9BB48|nr:hypothetical protein [Streptomyces sp. 5-6(2022)]